MVRQTRQTALDGLMLARNSQAQWRSKLQILESQVLDLMTHGKSQDFRLVFDESNVVKIVNKSC